VKRLAVEVEDHTLDFLHFEGEISEGEYGSGKILIWDTGEYDFLKLEKKRIEFVLHGKKVSGKYILLHWKNKDWLLMKVLYEVRYIISLKEDDSKLNRDTTHFLR